MDISTLAAYSSVAKDVSAWWKSMTGDDKNKVDEILKKVVLLLPDNLERQKKFFTSSNDVLPIRLLGLAMDRECRGYLLDLVGQNKNRGSSPVDSDEFVVVRCTQCGNLRPVPMEEIIAQIQPQQQITKEV